MEHPGWFPVELATFAAKTLGVLALVWLAAKWTQRRYGDGNGRGGE